MLLVVPQGNGENQPHQRRKQQTQYVPLAHHFSTSTRNPPLLKTTRSHHSRNDANLNNKNSFSTASAGGRQKARRKNHSNGCCSRLIMRHASTFFNRPFLTLLGLCVLILGLVGPFTVYQTIQTIKRLSGLTYYFPLSIRDDVFESITFVYPGNPELSTTLSVPKFWYPSSRWKQQQQQQGKKFTHRIASSIGSYSPGITSSVGGLFTNYFTTTTASSSGHSSSSTDWDLRTIFVGISTYKSLHCQSTVEQIFLRAKHPDRVRVGIVDHTDEDDVFSSSCDIPLIPCDDQPNQALCKYYDHIDVFQFNNNNNNNNVAAKIFFVLGPMLVRHMVERLYRGEYYVLLTNVNNVMVSGWDTDAIRQFESLSNEMAILSTIPTAANDKNLNMATWTALRDIRVVLCNAEFIGESYATKVLTILQQDQQPETVVQRGTPQLQPYWSFDFSFSRGHFVLNVPYDPYVPLVIDEEIDLSMSIRAFTHGYDIYTPKRPLCFYFETTFNINRYLKDKAEKYPSLVKSSADRLFAIIKLQPQKSSPSSLIEEEEKMLYGLGSERDATKFFSTFGIHVQEKITEKHLCNFVSTGRMHNLFHEHVKPDKMGIDYNEIHFRFHELLNNHE